MIKKENGITLIILIVTVMILMIIAGVVVTSGINSAKTATRESLKTNMMLIKVKGIESVENTNFQLGTAERSEEEKQKIKDDNLIGKKTTDSLPVEIAEGEEAYELTSQNMQDLGLGELSDTSSDYVIIYNVSEENVDVIYKPGINENNKKYYALSDMEEAGL